MYYDDPIWGSDGWWLEKWCQEPVYCDQYFIENFHPLSHYAECANEKPNWKPFEHLEHIPREYKEKKYFDFEEDSGSDSD